VELTGPSGGLWVWGEPDASEIVRGSAEEFCLVVTQRRNIADTRLQYAGDHVKQWLAMAQAFAGTGAEVRRWYEVDAYLGTMLNVMDGFVLVWIVVIFLALSFGLVNTLVMAVFERVREIGLMLALGMRPRDILGQVVIESLLLLAIGLAIGSALSWLSVQPIKDGIDVSIVGEGMEMWGVASVLYPELLWSDVVLANVVVLTLGFVASLSPAWRASRYEPVEAIRKV